MKIGFRAKNYFDVVCFEIDDHKDRERFIDEMINYISTSPEDELDLLVTVKQRNNQTKGENETD